ncbi:MAG TPA: hypothetical protein VFR32_04005 [Gaiellaceae bacterium]|nr:hypothetical protein [Gaiellaceae bacterium]
MTAAPLSRNRKIAVWALILLAALIGFVSALTVWVKRQALETDRWVETSTRLLEDDEIRGALSIYLVDQLYANVDVAGELQASLPEQVKPLAAPIAGGLRELSVRAANNLLQRPAVQTLWEEANRKAHEALIRIVDDKGELLQTGEGDVVLDLRPFVQQLGDRIGLGERLEQRLGPDAGRIVIMESDQLGTAQTIVKIIRKLSVFLALAVLALFVAAVYIARGHRRETLRAVGVTFVVVGGLLLVVRRLVGDWLVDTLTSGEPIRDPATKAWLIGTDLLAGVAWTAVAYGAVIILAAVLAGPSGPAVSVRRRLAPSFAERPGMVYAVVGGLYLLVVLWGPTPAFRQPLWILIFGALIALGTEAFRRLTLAERATAA